MREEFRNKGKIPWVVMKDSFVFNGTIIPYTDFQEISIVSKGTARIVYCGKTEEIGWSEKDDERALRAISYANLRIFNDK